ncbi:MAG: hypothetical protein U1G07_23130 [Verrucomicrobiota bacterium]
MKSHCYAFTVKDLLPIVGLPLVPLGLFALFLHAGAALRILPPPVAALDTDRTILLHQATAGRQRHDAGTILIGDSSCLMDVSAPQLTTILTSHGAALNLGTLSYLDLNAFAALLRRYTAANPVRPDTVVLLMNPEALRRPAAEDYDLEALERFYSQTDDCPPTLSPLLCGLGVEIFRGRLLSRSVPIPLPGSFGGYYGFTHDLWRYLSSHQGSAVDPGRYDPAFAVGNAEYRLARTLESASAVFRAAVPAGTKLCVGITPLPESFVLANFGEVRGRLLAGWSQWLKADLALARLPATMPDHLFASPTHLNPAGARAYTTLLAAALQGEPSTRPQRPKLQ